MVIGLEDRRVVGGISEMGGPGEVGEQGVSLVDAVESLEWAVSESTSSWMKLSDEYSRNVKGIR